MDPLFTVAGLLGVATDIDAIERDIVLRLHAESVERRAEREQPRRWRRGRVLAQREHAERVKERNDDAAIIARARLLGWDPKRERWVPTALRGVS